VGFIGACGLIALDVAVVVGALRAVFSAQDRFGLLLSVGLVSMLAFHMIVNIGMTIGIMPVTGIPLPFMSYGGSALITNYIAVASSSTSRCKKTASFSATPPAASTRLGRLRDFFGRRDRALAKRKASSADIGARRGSLHEAAAEVADQLALLDRLDGLRDDFGVEAAGERDDAGYDRDLRRIVGGRDDERAIDLDRVDLEIVEVA